MFLFEMRPVYPRRLNSCGSSRTFFCRRPLETFALHAQVLALLKCIFNSFPLISPFFFSYFVFFLFPSVRASSVLGSPSVGSELFQTLLFPQLYPSIFLARYVISSTEHPHPHLPGTPAQSPLYVAPPPPGVDPLLSPLFRLSGRRV